MPTSHPLKFGETQTREIERICRECMSEGDVLLLQPEHILSLKLMCLDCFIAEKDEVARSLLKMSYSGQLHGTLSTRVVRISASNLD